MKKRDVLTFVSAGLTLVGIGGQFGPFWALIIGGIAGVALLVGLTAAELASGRGDGDAR